MSFFKMGSNDEKKEGITIFFKALILSELIINFIPTNVFLYSLMIVEIWIIILVDLNPKTNKSKIGQFLIVSVANIIALLIMLWRDGVKPSFENEGCIGILLVLIVLLFVFLYTYVQVENEKPKKEKNLFSRREQDLKRILDCCEQVDMSILGIEAVWGDGKTFLVEKLQEVLIEEKNYEVITIDVLACNLDNLPQILLEELDNILYKNRILSKYSGKLKNFFSKEKKMEFLGDLLSEENESYAKAFDSLKDELRKINKNIVIIYEDIDRIVDGKLIQKIFYISEKLTYKKDYIKIIYQYNPVHLKKILYKEDIDAAFLEKYIPYTLSLSGINFLEVIEQFLKEKNIPTKRLVKNDFSVLDKDCMLFSKFIPEALKKPADVMDKVTAVFTSIQSIRKIEHFLIELNEVLDHEEFLLKYKNIIRDIVFIKHFFPKVYSQFKAEKTFNDYFKVMIKTPKKRKNKDPLSMDRIIKDNRIIDLNNDDFEKYIAYMLLLKNKEDSQAEDEFYEKTTRIIGHLLEPWQSIMIDYEWIVNAITPVLDLDLNSADIVKEYQKVVDRVVEGKHNLKQENKDFFVKDRWALYFKAFNRYFIDDQMGYFEKLLSLYFKIEKPKKMDMTVFRTLQPSLKNMSKKQLNVFLKKMIKIGTEFQYEGEGCNDFFECIEKKLRQFFYFDNEKMMGEMVGTKWVYSEQTFIQIKDQLKEYDDVMGKYGKYIEFDKEVKNILAFCDLVIYSKSSEDTEPAIPAEENEGALGDDEFLEKMKTADKEAQEKLIKQYVKSQSYYPIHILKALKQVEEQKND